MSQEGGGEVMERTGARVAKGLLLEGWQVTSAPPFSGVLRLWSVGVPLVGLS